MSNKTNEQVLTDKVKDLEKENAALTKKLEVATKKTDELKAELKEASNPDASAEIEGLQSQVKELMRENRALGSTKGNKLPQVKLKDGRIVQIMHALRTKDGVKSPAEMAADPEFCEAQVAKASSAFQVVNA